MVFKLDLEKMYDLVNWNFLDRVKKHKSFGDHGRNWISGCFSMAIFLVIVNGDLVWFKAQWGI